MPQPSDANSLEDFDAQNCGNSGEISIKRSQPVTRIAEHLSIPVRLFWLHDQSTRESWEFGFPGSGYCR
jgi:hypothetical protein